MIMQQFKTKESFIKFACLNLDIIHPNQLAEEYGFNQSIALDLCIELEKAGYYKKEVFLENGEQCAQWNNQHTYIKPPSIFTTFLNYIKSKLGKLNFY